MSDQAEKFLAEVTRTATLLGHKLKPWARDSFGYFTRCQNCQIEIRAKVYVKTTTLTTDECKGKRES